MDCNCITLWWHKICIPKVTLPTHCEFLVHYWKSLKPEETLYFRIMIMWIIKCGSNIKVQESSASLIVLWSEDNILIDISEGRWLIIGNSSPLITHQWHYVHAYLLKTPAVWQHFICKSGNNYRPHQWWRRQVLFVSNDIVCDIEHVIKSFAAKMLSRWSTFFACIPLCPIVEHLAEQSLCEVDQQTGEHLFLHTRALYMYTTSWVPVGKLQKKHL